MCIFNVTSPVLTLHLSFTLYTVSSKHTATRMLKEAAYFPGIHTDDHVSGGFSDTTEVVIKMAKEMLENIRKKW